MLLASCGLGALAVAGLGGRVWLANHRLGDPDFMANAPARERARVAERVLSFPIGNHHDACLALGEVGDARSIPALIGGLRWVPDDGSCTAMHCLDALEGLTGYEASSREAWSTWWEETGSKLPASALPLPEPPARAEASGPACSSAAVKEARQAEPRGACASLDRGLGGQHTCVRRADGGLWCWGKAIPHRLGLGKAALPSPVVEAGHEVVQLASSGDRTCVVNRGGDLRCWAWGAPESAPVTRAAGMAEVALGARRLCGLAAGGSLSCWTMGSDGALERGTTSRARGRARAADLRPEVGDLGAAVSSVSVGDLHICAALSDGSVWCWGGNDMGQRGGGDHREFVPVRVAALGTCVAEVSAGERHTCARMVDGSVSCWGRNDGGESGDGTTSRRTDAPTKVVGLSGVRQIAAGARHTCARRDDGSVWCWGENGHGELGASTTAHAATPVQVSGLGGVVEIAAGAHHTCARKGDGSVWCWGDNTRGQLGDGTTEGHITPVKAFSCDG